MLIQKDVMVTVILPMSMSSILVKGKQCTCEEMSVRQNLNINKRLVEQHQQHLSLLLYTLV